MNYSRQTVRAIIATTVVLMAMLIYNHLNTSRHVLHFDTLWEDYENNTARYNHYLNGLISHWGYGGFIHHFKNLVLRGDESRIPLAYQQLTGMKQALEGLSHLSSTPAERNAIHQLSKTIGEYEQALVRAAALVRQGVYGPSLDRQVRVDDRTAIEALALLFAENEQRTTQMNERQGTNIQATLNFLAFDLVLLPLIIIAAWLLVHSINRLSHANATIAEKEQQMEAIFAASPDAILHVDARGEIVRANPRATELFGYAPGELTHAPLEKLLPERFRNRHREQVETFSDNPQDLRRMGERRLVYARRKDGSEVPVDISLAQVKLGQQPLTVATIHDITEQLARDQALRDSEERLRLSQYIAQLGSWDWDIAADRMLWSDEMYLLFGVSPGEFHPDADNYLRLIHPDDQPALQQLLLNVDVPGGEQTIQHRIIRPDGEERQLLLRVVLYLDDSGTPRRIIGVVEDNTDAQRLVERLRLGNEQLEKTQAISHAGSWEWDIISGRLQWSDETYRIFGYAPQAFEASYQRLIDQLHDEDRARVIEAINTAVRDSQAGYDVEHRIVRSDGVIRHVHQRGEVFRDEGGQARQMVGVLADVTEQKQTELALQRERALLRSLLNSIPDLIYYKDTGGYYLGCNQAFEKAYGHRAEELLGKSDIELFSATRAYQITQSDDEVLRSGESLQVEETVTYRDGNPQQLETRKSPYYASDGKLLGLIGISRDIGARKAAEAALRESEERLQRSQSIAHVGTWDWRLSDNRVVWSNELCRILGVSDCDGNFCCQNNASHQGYLQAVHPDDQLHINSAINTAIASRDKHLDLEHRIIRPDGEVRHVQVRGEVFRDEDGRATRLIAVVYDITDRKLSEQTLRWEMARAERYLQQSEAIMVGLDNSGRVTLVNPQCCKQLGYPESELLGQDWFATIAPESEGQQLRQQYQAFVENRESAETGGLLIHPLRTRDGRLLTFACYWTRMSDAQGQPDGALCAGHDISASQSAVPL